ncbi:MAG: GspE/PulE family protein [Gammaproteobacteria bacterium]|nr:MAG: GspE/PulE family protein [Gammaproteobacteria bacterium]
MTNYAPLFTGQPADEGQESSEAPQIYSILLVDDEPNVLHALQRVFRQENYRIHTAGNGREALSILKAQTCQLIISDYLMPGMNGGELLREVKARYPRTIRIMLTGHADTNAVVAAVKEGAIYKFMLKPWNDDDIRVTVALALEQYDLVQRNQELEKQNTAKAREINALAKLAVTNRSQLAIMLHKRSLLNDKQVQELYQQQQRRKEPMVKLVLEQDWVSERQFRDILRQEFMIEEVALAEIQVDTAVAALLPRSFCQRQWVLPLRQVKRHLTLVMADPLDSGLLDELRFTTGLEIGAVMAPVADIRAKIDEVYGEEIISFDELETMVSSADPFEGIEIIIEDDDDIPLDELLRGTDEPPAIRLVNAIILEAVRLRASDIHIHPRTKSVVVRYRIDGILVDKIQVPHHLFLSLVSRIKIMAELDISERRRPQDGRITVKTPLRILDLRISVLPTLNGEKIVMRLLDRNAEVFSLSALGLSDANETTIMNVVSKPQGIILATGPTGSGKTSTLYAMLQYQATPEKNYVTIEDPVEYYLDMAGQVMVREKIGLDFSSVLRAVLRQDPDVILLGEIRDRETAEVAFHAALTGHLVYTTLHTNSAIATIARLFELGTKSHTIASALEAIIAQRLVRKICEDCRTPVTPQRDLLHKLGPVFQAEDMVFFQGQGCDQCHQAGYLGRVGIYEILLPSEEMCHLISSGSSVREISEMARQENFTTLLEDAREKVKQGQTTLQEVLRVLGPQVL